MVADADSDQTVLFGVIKSLMHKKNGLPLPRRASPAQLAEEFGAFMDKATQIRSTLNAKRPVAAQPAQNPGRVPILDTFMFASVRGQGVLPGFSSHMAAKGLLGCACSCGH